MSLSEIQLFQILKRKLGESEAEELVSFVTATVQDEFDVRKQVFATKEDLNNWVVATKSDIDELRIATKSDINELRIATKNDISELRIATKNDINELRIATKIDIGAFKTELLKSIYLVGLIQFFAIIGSVLAIVNFMVK